MHNTGMVYAMTNAYPKNEVIAFHRESNGTLTRMDAYATGGSGTGAKEVSTATPQNGIDPLASQGSLSLSPQGNLLFAVNAGSGSISSFQITDNGRLTLMDVKPSGGAQPNSLAVYDNLLYVSNVGDAANNFNSNITGFRLSNSGHLTQVSGFTRPLSTPNAQPACIVFSPDGRLLVVTELTTNRISIFPVTGDGSVSGPSVNVSNGPGPFGCYFLSNGLLLVAEAVANALTSYRINANGTLNVISGSVPNGQMATCWVVATPNERFAYTSNTTSRTISMYGVENQGTLVVGSSTMGSPAGTSAGAPIDNGISKDGRNFYVLNGDQGSISVFQIMADGRLILLQVIMLQGLPVLGTQGLAVL